MPDTAEDRNRIFRQELRAYVATKPALARDGADLRIDAAIDRCAKDFVKDNSSRVTDQPSAEIVSYVGEVLGAFLALRELGLPEEEVRAVLIEALARWVRENVETYADARLGIRRDQPDEAFDNARANFKTRGEERFGSQFDYVIDVSDERRAHFGITRCLFNDLLRAAGYPEVIPVFCALDIVWADEVTDHGYNLAFSRPTTLAMGSDKCRFQFNRRHLRQRS